MEDIITKISTLIEGLQQVPNSTFDGERWKAPIESMPILQKYGINHEEYGNDVVILIKSFFLPNKVKYFPNLNSEIKPDDITDDLIIFDSGPSIVFYQAHNKTFTSFGNKNDKLLNDSRSLISYYGLFSFLKSAKFCDYYNASNNEIVIYNSNKGIQKVVFDTIPKINTLVDIEEKVSSLLDFASQLQFKFFVQNAMFTLSGPSGVINLNDVIAKAPEITSMAQRDFQLVNKKFNFETFQDALIKEKNKYFNSIRDVLSKVGSQSIGIPISIGATVFTSYKIVGDLPLGILVLSTFLIYVVFYIKIQLLFRRDVMEINRELVRDFDMIKQKSGLELSVIEAERSVILTRISKIKSIISWLIFMIVALALMVCFYLCNQMLVSGSQTVESALPRLL